MVGPRLRDGEGNVQVSHRRRPKMAHFLHKTYLLRWTGLFRRAHRNYRRRFFDSTAIQRVEVLMGAAMMVAKDKFDAVGGWDEHFTFGGEDVDFSLRVGRCADVVYNPQVEITHFGRVSTRDNLAFAAPHIANGFLRYLRTQKYSRIAVFLYKLIITMDTPIQIVWKSLEYGWRRLWRRPNKAKQSLSALKAHSHFLFRGVKNFWKN